MTKQEFEKDFAEGLGHSVETLHRAGLVAFPCKCGEPHCREWQIGDEGFDLDGHLGV